MEDINRLRDCYLAAWNTPGPFRPRGRRYTASEHERNGTELRAFAKVLEAEASRARQGPVDGDAAERRLTTAFGRLAVNALNWDPAWLETSLTAEFRDALQEFPRQARSFDPSLTPAEIYQAARNALTMHCLQALLGVRVEFTPAVLAYSLLYPYTDNLLDAAGLDRAAKLAFGNRLECRLRGVSVVPVGRREAQIFELVGMLEGQFARTRHPALFDSLLAIHSAQMSSLALFSDPDPDTLARIAIDKGGASVLADGYLVAGNLTSAQAECLFGLGVFLQLRDDLEDVEDDAAHGVRTVFSSRRRGRLDDPAIRSLAIGDAVVERLSCFGGQAGMPVRAIVEQALPLTLTDAAASFQNRFSRGFLDVLEQHSPFRLQSIWTTRRRLSKARGTLTALLQYWLHEDAHASQGGSRLPFLAWHRTSRASVA